MEFQYFFDNSYIQDSALTAFWPYPAGALSGNFTGNNPATGTFPTTQVVQRTLNLSADDDFALFATLKTYDLATPAAYKFRTQTIFSTASGGAGWDFGLLASNTFFISCPQGEIYPFEKIRAGEKNCVCLKRAGQSFTLYDYDIYSHAVKSEQTTFFSNDSNLDGGNLQVGYNSGTDIGGYSFSWFGTVDQLALITEPLDRATITGLLVGFEPKTFSYATGAAASLLDDTWRPLSGSIPTGYFNLLYPYIQDFKNYAVNSASGAYGGSFSGNVGATFTGRSSLAPTVDLCLSSGSALPTFIYNSTSGIAGLSGYIVEDNVKINNFAAGLSDSRQDQSLVSHTIKIYNNSFSYRFNYDALYQRGGTSTSFTEAIDTSYYSGFYMSGISQNDYYNNILLLAVVTGIAPTGIGLLGTFDNVQGLFSVIPESGIYYYNGYRVSPSGISKDGTYVDVLDIVESGNDSLVYDLSSGLQLRMLGMSGYATGAFYPRTSVAFTGETSYSLILRTLDHKETVPLHMYHGQPVLYKSTGNAVDNLEDFWV